MRLLRAGLISLTVVLAFVFNIERLDFGEADVVDIQTFVYALVLLAVLSVIVVPTLHRSHYSLSLVVWGAVYWIAKAWVFNTRPLLGGVYTYLTVTEFSLVMVTVAIAHRVGAAAHEFERAVENITLYRSDQKVRRLSEAADEIETEMLRSRRHRYALSVIVVEPDPATIEMRMHRIVQEVQREMLGRYVRTALANTLGRELRRTDLVLEQPERGRFVVLSPETNATGSAQLVQRLQASARERLGVELTCGIATFPDSAVSFDELVHGAEANLHAIQIHERRSPDRAEAVGTGGG